VEEGRIGICEPSRGMWRVCERGGVKWIIVDSDVSGGGFAIYFEIALVIDDGNCEIKKIDFETTDFYREFDWGWLWVDKIEEIV